MIKKISTILFTFSILFTTIQPVIVQAATEETVLTSKMYGTSETGKINFDVQTCHKGYKEINKEITDAKKETKFKYDDKDGLEGLSGKMMNMVNDSIFTLGQAFSNVLFGAGCYIGVAPAQLLQFMFFPVVLDEYDFLNTLTTSVRTISIFVLFIITGLSIFELNKKEGNVTPELVQKIGFFLLSAGLISFSKFILQGIYDIANVLGYYISNYKIYITVVQGADPAKIPVNLMNLPTIFVTYIEYAFSPKALNGLPSFNLQMLLILSVIKIIVLVFIIKDMLQLAIYGLRRMVTMISSGILLPVLAALIPSYKTQDIFNKYFRSVIAVTFTPIIFGLIYLGSAPFVIQDLLELIEAPILKVLAIVFFLNILSGIPQYVDGLLGSSNTIGSPSLESGLSKVNGGKAMKSEFREMNKISRDLKAQGGGSKRQVAGTYVKRKYGNVLYGKEKK